ncbi:MAG: hypothetical protein GC155_06530 [Alphaproteobacteria bacterium]|nr:hypothetical protein [Alphaproteobacteria bacterium]
MSDLLAFLRDNALSAASLAVSSLVAISLALFAAQSSRRDSESRIWREMVVPQLAEFLAVNERIISMESELWAHRDAHGVTSQAAIMSDIKSAHLDLLRRTYAIELLLDPKKPLHAKLMQALNGVRSTSYLNESTRLVMPGEAEKQLRQSRNPEPIFETARAIARRIG